MASLDSDISLRSDCMGIHAFRVSNVAKRGRGGLTAWLAGEQPSMGKRRRPVIMDSVRNSAYDGSYSARKDGLLNG